MALGYRSREPRSGSGGTWTLVLFPPKPKMCDEGEHSGRRDRLEEMNIERCCTQANLAEIVARREGDEVRALALRQVPQAAPDLMAVVPRQAEIDQRNLRAEERRDLDGGRVPPGTSDRMTRLFEIRPERLELVGIVLGDQHAPGAGGHGDDLAVEAVTRP